MIALIIEDSCVTVDDCVCIQYKSGQHVSAAGGLCGIFIGSKTVIVSVSVITGHWSYKTFVLTVDCVFVSRCN